MGGGSQDDLGCLQLPLLGKNKHPHPLIFMRGIQSNILEAFDPRGLCLMLGFTSLFITRPGRCALGNYCIHVIMNIIVNPSSAL